MRLGGAAPEHDRRVSPTLVTNLRSILTVLLNIILVIAILDIFGIQTTSFAAPLAGADRPARDGLLTRFGTGVFMQVQCASRWATSSPVGGVAGAVTEIGLFSTTVTSPDNMRTIVGNNKAFVDTIPSCSILSDRRPISSPCAATRRARWRW